MSKDKIADYDGTTAGNNTDIGGISIAEGMLPSAVNNSMRELTKQLGAFANGTDAIDALTVTGDLTVDTNTLVVDAANNSVGIGTTSLITASGRSSLTLSTANEKGELHLQNRTATTSSDTGVLTFNNGSNRIGAIQSTADGATDKGKLIFMSLSGGSVAGRMDLTEHGLTFNGDTAAANALSDFETGSWTPSFDNSIGNGPTVTYTYQIGRYTKVGNRVHWTARISWSAFSMNGSGYALLAGFPFTADSTTAFSQGSNTFGYASGIGGSDGLSGLYIDPGANKFYMTTSANPTAELLGSNIGSAGAFYCGGSVQV